MNGFRRKVVLNSGWSLMKVVFHQGSFTWCRVSQVRAACGPQRPRMMLKELTLFSFFLLFFSTSLSFAGNSGHLTQVRHSSRKSSATHPFQCVEYFRVSRQWYGCQYLGFLTGAQMLLHAIVHRGCTDSLSLHWRLTPGEKSLDSNPCQHCTWLFSQMLHQLSCSPPQCYLVEKYDHNHFSVPADALIYECDVQAVFMKFAMIDENLSTLACTEQQKKVPYTFRLE